MARNSNSGGSSRDGAEDPDIPFPFEPYDVQKQLMRKIYSTIDKAGIGIFESPTGTGKSLSVICSALQWLKDAEAKDVDGSDTGQAEQEAEADGAAGDVGDGGDDGDGDNSMPSWLKDLTRQKSESDKEARAKRIQERRRDLDRRLAAVRRQQDQDKRNLSRVRGVHHRHGSGGAGGPAAGAGRKRPRPPKSSPSPSLSELHPKRSPAAVAVAAGGHRGRAGSAAAAGAAVSGEQQKQRPGYSAEEEGAAGGGDAEFLVAEYDSGKEGGGGVGGDGGCQSSDEEGTGMGGKEEEEEKEEWADLGLRQILYVSRTHSQTSQFVNEVKKTAFAQGVRCASLGSRRTLCGNEKVSSLKTDGKMRDACLDLQKNKKKAKGKKGKDKDKKSSRKTTKKKKNGNKAGGEGRGRGATIGKYGGGGEEDKDNDKDEEEEEEEEDTGDGCPLLAAKGQREFPYRALASVRDIEELAELGKQEGTCSYYGARKAAALAQLVVMPYAALLSREARDAMGVRLDGAVVVVDEAHNIVEAINSVHSKKIGLSEVARAHSQLSQYEARYGARLKGSNAFYVGNILRLLRAVLKFLTKGKEKLQVVRAGKIATGGAAAGPGASGGGGGQVRAREADGEMEEAARSEMMEINDFLFRAGLDNVNLFKLQRYMRRSEISRKVMGFMDLSAAQSPEVTLQAKPPRPANGGAGSHCGCSNAAAAAAAAGEPAEGTSVGAAGGGAGDGGGAFVSKHFSALQTVEGFLDALTNASRDGRVLATYGGKEGGGSNARAGTTAQKHKQQQQQQRGAGEQQQRQEDEEASVKFLMLNPSVHFDEIVQKARALVLVGGTMQPTGDLVRQLFSSVDPSRVEVFSCGHVIPKENLLPLCVPRGPSGKTFNFTFHRRGTDEQLDELGRLMTNVCKLVPGGVVCFLASYGYLDQVIQRWKASGTLRQLNKLKSVFAEPRSAKDVDVVLRDFSLAARAGAWKSPGGGGGGGSSAGGSSGGGLLLSVVGAKMSEGINFSDDLARCVVMVGLPYPDKRDAELKQKMAYLDEASPGSRGRAGREYYSSICMRAVNQSIGRSIRHAGDYASILLVDERYRDEQVVRLLPGWIGERVVKPANFGQSFVALRRFFAEMHARTG